MTTSELTEKQYSLSELGWRPMYQQQIGFDELEQGFPARVEAVHRDRLDVRSEQGRHTLPINGVLDREESAERPTIGDWLWLEHRSLRPLKRLERMSVLSRIAAGTEPKTQLIAANLDTIFVVSSCNQDFNVSRLERYLSLILAAHIPAAIVLTKSDLCEDVDHYLEQARAIHRDVPVIAVDARSADSLSKFQPWLGKGQTIAFLGSSGVGKSTLTNLLIGQHLQDTGGIREDDAKGRHTTTGRSLHAVPGGGWVMDTPGMRELRLNDDASGVSELFADIESLMTRCRFRNCHHGDDSGCAVQQAIADGELEQRRWQSYLKLQREAEHAGLTKAEARSKFRKFTKSIKSVHKQRKDILHGSS